MFLGVLMFADAATKLTEIEVALGDEGSHSELAGQRKGLTTALLGHAGLESVAMRGHLCVVTGVPTPRSFVVSGSRARSSACRACSEVLGKTPGHEIDLSELMEAGATPSSITCLLVPETSWKSRKRLVVAF